MKFPVRNYINLLYNYFNRGIPENLTKIIITFIMYSTTEKVTISNYLIHQLIIDNSDKSFEYVNKETINLMRRNMNFKRIYKINKRGIKRIQLLRTISILILTTVSLSLILMKLCFFHKALFFWTSMNNNYYDMFPWRNLPPLS